MKKILSFLVVLTLVFGLTAVYATAEADAPFEILSPIDVQAYWDGITEEVDEGDGLYTKYKWWERGSFLVDVNGYVHNDTFANLMYDNNFSEKYNFTFSDNQSAANPWVAPDHSAETDAHNVYTGHVLVKEIASGATVMDTDVTIHLHEEDLTQVESRSAADIEYWTGAEYPYPYVVYTKEYDCGHKTVYNASFTKDWEWPTAAGTYDKVIKIDDVSVPVKVTVKQSPTSGKCGDTMNWSLDLATGTLTISGTGKMTPMTEGYEEIVNLPEEDLHGWLLPGNRYYVKKIVVEEGVEELCNYAFAYNTKVEAVSLPTTLKQIPELGFICVASGEQMTSLTIPEGITSITGWPFGSPGNSFLSLTELYLPSTLTELDPLTMVFTCMKVGDSGLELSGVTFRFAGTEEQWNAIKKVQSPMFEEMLGVDYDQFMEYYGKYFDEIPVVFEPKAEITVENGTATVPDEVVTVESGKDVVIDVVATEKPATEALLGAATVEKLAEANTKVEVKLPDATLSFDAAAMGNIAEKSGEKAVTLVAKEVEQATLSTAQKDALKDKNVAAVLTLEVLAGDTKITEFGGGKVTVSIPFQLPEGKTADQYYVAHIAEDGTVTAMETTYQNEALFFSTNHFSQYAVLEKTADKNPGTADVVLLPALLVSAVALAAATFVVWKRKKA